MPIAALGARSLPKLTELATNAILGAFYWSAKVNVHLTPELEQLVQSRVKSGRYGSASEVIREALLLLEQRDEDSVARKGEIRTQIDEGWAAAKRGDLVDGDEVFNRIDTELEIMKKSAGK